MQGLEPLPAHPPAIFDRSNNQKNDAHSKKEAKSGNFAEKNEVFCKQG